MAFSEFLRGWLENNYAENDLTHPARINAGKDSVLERRFIVHERREKFINALKQRQLNKTPKISINEICGRYHLHPKHENFAAA